MTDTVIPKRFHRLWLGGPEPEWTRPFKQTWLDHHPGWEMVEWDDGSVAELFPLHNQQVFDSAEAVCPSSPGQLKGDIVRYEILYRFGGVYIDTDFECLRSIEPLLEGIGAFAAKEDKTWVNNAIMGAVPGHPLLGDLVRHLRPNVVRFPGRKPNVLTGPQFLTKVIARHKEVEVYGSELFYPYNYADTGSVSVDDRFPEAYAIHHWRHLRSVRGHEPA